MNKPLEVKLREIEYSRVREALKAWEGAGCPEDGPILGSLRRRVADYAAAQKLVEGWDQSRKMDAKFDSIMANDEARKSLIEAGFL